MYVHALHTVHALPVLRVAGGRLGDGVSVDFDHLEVTLVIKKPTFHCAETHRCNNNRTNRKPDTSVRNSWLARAG
jgi:hypothetical protein